MMTTELVGTVFSACTLQFFGQVSVSAETEAMTVRLRDNSGAVLWSQELAPRR
jgi:alkaline phosphatase D